MGKKFDYKALRSKIRVVPLDESLLDF